MREEKSTFFVRKILLFKSQIKTKDFLVLEQKLSILYLYYTWNTHLRWKRFLSLMGQREHGEGVRHSTKELASRLRLSGYRQFHIHICCLYV
jgi:hypothetical protein